MANLNIFVEQDFYDKFKELKALLKCKTNEEALKEIMNLAQQFLQQQLLSSMKPAAENQQQKNHHHQKP